MKKVKSKVKMVHIPKTLFDSMKGVIDAQDRYIKSLEGYKKEEYEKDAKELIELLDKERKFLDNYATIYKNAYDELVYKNICLQTALDLRDIMDKLKP